MKPAKPAKQGKRVWAIALLLTLAGVSSVLWLREEQADAANQQSEQVVSQEAKTVAVINGAAVDEREFQLFLQSVKAQVASYFLTTYKAEVSQGFWTDAYGGEVPLVKAKQLALDKLKEVKVKQLMAQKRGLLKDPGYPAFLEALTKENQRRKEALRQQLVIYGPQQYDAWGYYTYLVSNLEPRIKDTINEAEGPFADRKLLDERYALLVKQELQSVKVVVDEPSLARIKMQ